MGFSSMEMRVEEKGVRSRFDKRTQHLRITARITLGVIASLIPISALTTIEPPPKEIIAISENRKPTRKPEIVEPELPVKDIEIRIIFSDESGAEPYAGYDATLDDWKDVPEWDIPQEYKDTGGCLPESVRTYLYNLCGQYNISYPLMLALIEKESGYQWDAESPDGSCKGYAMINDKWHQERMQKFGVEDIYDPYGNLKVAVDYLSELFIEYHDADVVLMCYNCGESGARSLMEDGIYSTDYAEKILAREAEISHEIYGY